MRNATILILIITTQLYNISFAQSPGFSQTSANQMYVNPAFTGSKECPRLFGSYRNKYISLDNAYISYFLSYDQTVKFLKGDIGLTFERDVQGQTFYSHDIGLYYAKGFRLTRKLILKLGVAGQYLSTKLNTEYITTPDMIDPIYGFVNSSYETYDETVLSNVTLSSGALIFTNKMFLGFSAKNLTEPKIKNTSSILRYRTYLIHFSYKIEYNSTNTLDGLINFHPSIYAELNKISGVFQYGLYVNKKKLLGGLWLKQNFTGNYESFIVLIGIVQKKFKFAYSCDISLSQRSGVGFDIHEISYTHYLRCRQKKKHYEAIKAPTF